MNTDKRYLDDLVNAGLPVVPFVIKPTVSLGARDAARYESGDEVAREHICRLRGEGHTVMVQPYLGWIDATGEVGVIFIGGRYSHSIRRAALLREVQRPGHGLTLPLNVQAHEPSPQERTLAERVIRHPASLTELLYARIDLVLGPNGEPLIREMELTEAALFLDFSDGGADRLANALGVALDEGGASAVIDR